METKAQYTEIDKSQIAILISNCPELVKGRRKKICLFITFCFHCSTNSVLIGYLYHADSFIYFDYHSSIRSKSLYLPIGILRLLPPFLLLRSVEPPFVYKHERFSIKPKKKKRSKQSSFVKLQDRESHYELAYHDHQDGSEATFPLGPPHPGNGPRGISK